MYVQVPPTYVVLIIICFILIIVSILTTYLLFRDDEQTRSSQHSESKSRSILNNYALYTSNDEGILIKLTKIPNVIQDACSYYDDLLIVYADNIMIYNSSKSPIFKTFSLPITSIGIYRHHVYVVSNSKLYYLTPGTWEHKHWRFIPVKSSPIVTYITNSYSYDSLLLTGPESNYIYMSGKFTPTENVTLGVDVHEQAHEIGMFQKNSFWSLEHYPLIKSFWYKNKPMFICDSQEEYI